MNAKRKRVKAPAQRECRQDPYRLRRRRTIARMTQAQLAAAARCSVSYLCELEQGNYSATPGLLGRLADALGCDITEIMPAEVVAALDELGPAGERRASGTTAKRNHNKRMKGLPEVTITDIPPASPPDTDQDEIAALAISLQLLARYVMTALAGDLAILGLTRIPGFRVPLKLPARGSDDGEMRVRVDEFAERHGVTAATDERSGHYEAAVSFGAGVSVVAYMVPEKVMAARLAEAKKRREDIAREVAAQHDAITAGRPAA